MKIKIIAGMLTLIFLSAAVCAILLYNGIIWFNNPSRHDYPVRGVDVSAYQGEIDWSILSGQGIDFAFIKATEGSTFKDKRFKYNWENANKTQLKVGAYHFLSFESSGITQADNFISTVPVLKGTLPPVIDIEFYGDRENNPLHKEKTSQILNDILTKLEKYYDQKPIIYATQKSYDLYIRNDFDDYPIWIRDILRKPNWLGSTSWTFWQYSNRGTLKGYNGDERFIDMNVFNGTANDLEKLLN